MPLLLLMTRAMLEGVSIVAAIALYRNADEPISASLVIMWREWLSELYYHANVYT